MVTKINKFLVIAFALLLGACNLPSAAGEAPLIDPVGIYPALPENSDSLSGMHIRFTNLTEGGSISGTFDENGKPKVVVQFKVTGIAPPGFKL